MKFEKRKLRSYIPLVESYLNASAKQRQKAIKKMNLENINILCECVLNVLLNPHLTSPRQKRLMEMYITPFNEHLYDLICCKMCLRERRNLCIYMNDVIALLLKLLHPSLLHSCGCLSKKMK